MLCAAWSGGDGGDGELVKGTGTRLSTSCVGVDTAGRDKGEVAWYSASCVDQGHVLGMGGA